MREVRIPEVPAGKLDRHTKLFAFAFIALGGAILFGHLIEERGRPFYTLDFAVRSGTPLLALGAALGIGLALAVLIPLWSFARLVVHPAAAVRRWATLGTFTVIASLIAPFAISSRAVPRGAGNLLLPLYVLTVVLLFVLLRRAHREWCAATTVRGATLSVSIICKDEVDRIGRTLDAVHGWADEIVVLDSGSTDGTVELVKRYTDKVAVTDWPGFGVQKQRALARCTGEWVLSLDADEVPSAELLREIDAMIAARTGHGGFHILRGSVVFGGPVDFGADGDHHVRLFRREQTRFDGKPVHEDVIVAGTLGRLESPLWHFTFRDFGHLRAKFGEYAWLQAQQRFADGKRASAFGALPRGLLNFVLMYFWRLGLLDGRRGLLMAALYAHYTFDKYAALWSLGQRPTE